MNAAERKRAAELLKPIVEPPGFTGAAPGGPSRWRRGENAQWFPVRSEIVVEVAFDGVQTSSRYPGGLALRFARVKGYRPDKAAADADTIDTVRAIHRGPGRAVGPEG